MDNSRAIFQANSINQLNICAFIKFMIIKNNIHGPSLKMEEGTCVGGNGGIWSRERG